MENIYAYWRAAQNDQVEAVASSGIHKTTSFVFEGRRSDQAAARTGKGHARPSLILCCINHRMLAILQGDEGLDRRGDGGQAKPLEERRRHNSRHVKSWKGGYMWRLLIGRSGCGCEQ
jgi:hypothetical protein